MPSIINSTTTNGIVVSADNSGVLQLASNNGTTAVTIDGSQNVGVGTSSPTDKLTIAHADEKGITFKATGTDGTTAAQLFFEDTNGGTGGVLRFDHDVNSFTFATAGTTERMRINSAGDVCIGTTSVAGNQQALVVRSADVAGKLTATFICTSSATSAYGVAVNYSALAPNNSGAEFYVASDSSTTRFYVSSNGGIGNYSGNNVNLSDAREKTNVELAGNYLDKICAIPVKTFNYIDQNREDDDGLTLGVVAQDVQAVAPELVTESNWAKMGEEAKMRFSIYQTDLQYALMKSIQELNAKVEAQAVRIAELEGAR